MAQIQTLEELFIDIAREDEEHVYQPHELKGVTVRLDLNTVCELDAFASVTGMNRQQMLQTLINNGLATAMTAFFSNVSEERHEDYVRVYHDLCEQNGINPEDYQ